MFGGFELQLPSAWTSRLSRDSGDGRRSLPSAAGLGFVSALIVGPCVTAPLAGALLYIAQTGDVGLGAAALFFLGLGKGVPLIVFGRATTLSGVAAGSGVAAASGVAGASCAPAGTAASAKMLPAIKKAAFRPSL